MTTALYAIYKQTSDLNDLPDYVLSLCADCAAAPSTRTAVKLDTDTTHCDHCDAN